MMIKKEFPIVISLIIAAGMLTTVVLKVTPNLSRPTTQQSIEETKITSSEETIKVLAGRSRFVLPDGETKIIFSRSGTPSAVPDVVFGNEYSLNDIHNINYLAIRKSVSFYNNGYLITLTNSGCNTVKKFTDIPEIHVTDCTIKLASKKAESPIAKVKPISKIFVGNESSKNVLTKEPFVQIEVPQISLMYWDVGEMKGKVGLKTESMTSYATEVSWNMPLVTSFGLDTVSYTANEVLSQKSKKINVGPMEIITTVKSMNCRIVYEDKNGGTTKQCDDIVIDIDVRGTEGTVKIVNYEE